MSIGTSVVACRQPCPAELVYEIDAVGRERRNCCCASSGLPAATHLLAEWTAEFNLAWCPRAAKPSPTPAMISSTAGVTIATSAVTLPSVFTRRL